MDLTAFEKRDLIGRVTELAKINVIKKQDRDDIYRICMVACDHAIAEMKERQK